MPVLSAEGVWDRRAASAGCGLQEPHDGMVAIMPRPVIDRTGQIHGRLTILSTSRADGVTRVRCRCQCGTDVTVAVGEIVSGHVQSCGCLRRDLMRQRQTTHGEAANGRESPEYRAWRGMINRCERPDVAHKRIYQDRGIGVCDRWRHSFEAFLYAVGRKPSPEHTLDRFPRNDGNYEPGNVRWATRSQQARNRRERPRKPNGDYAPGVL